MKKVKEQIETGKMELQNTLVAGHEVLIPSLILT